jgi:hypothetical protein
MQDYDFSDPDSTEANQTAHQRRMAEAMMAQATMGNQPAYSSRAALARVLMGGLAGMQLGGVEGRERALAQRSEAGRQREMDQLFEFVNQKPTQGPGMPQMDDEGNPMPGNMEQTAARRMELARMMMGAKNPMLQKVAFASLTAQPKEEEAFTLKPGERRFKGDRVVAEVPEAEKREGPKLGQLRERIQGEQMIQEEWDGSRWTQIGGGGRWNPKAGTTVNVNGPKENFKNEKTLRDEFTEASKPFVKIRDAYSQVKDALSGDITAPATLAGATKFMKMLDPESVVRESELNMALKSSGMLDRFTNLHNIVAKGQVLTPAQAKEIQRIAGVLYGTAESQQKKVGDYYTKLAAEYELEPSRIVRDLTPSGTAGGGVARIKSDAEYNALPSGATFIGPDGKTRRKP